MNPLRTASLALCLALAAPRVAHAQTPASAATDAPRVTHRPLGVTPSDAAVTLQAVVTFPHLVDRLTAHHRVDDGPWRAVDFARAEGGLEASLPAPGFRARRVDYHLTLTLRDGTTREVFATRDDPHTVVVQRSDGDEAELADLLRARERRLEFIAGGEYTSFGARPNPNGSVCGPGRDRCEDWWFSAWGEVRYHFHRAVRSVAVRVERLQGTTTRGDTAVPGLQDVGLVATTAEVEFRPAAWISLAASGILGANELSVQGGGGARVDLGVNGPARVNLAFRGIFNFGVLTSAWLRFDAARDTTLGAGVEVANQPGANENWGVRLLLEAGHQFGRHFGVTLRGGYGARRVEAAGFTAGGALSLAF